MNTAANDIFTGTVFVKPAQGLVNDAVVSVPGDKSISHRAVMLGSIADGVTEVYNFLEGEDNLSTIAAFRRMGVKVEFVKTSAGEAGCLRINGVGLRGLVEPDDVIDAGNSGTTARLVTGLLSAQPFFSVITGDETLRRRPMKRVVEPLTMMGAEIRGAKASSRLPLAINGNGAKGLKGIRYRTPAASAQLKSAILLAGLYAQGDTIIEEPEKSRDHTERMLALFGADITVERGFIRVSSTNSLNGCKIRVPGDISSAAFFMVTAMLLPESSLTISGVGVNPTRTGIIDILRKMGGSVEPLNATAVSAEPVANIICKGSSLKAIEITGEELVPAIDEFPIICVAAAFAHGTTTISGARELRVKESDRIAVMSECLTKAGVRNTEKEDGIIIEGSNGARIRGGRIDSHGDHRIAMAMAVAGLWSVEGMEINGSACVDVSFPGFFSLLDRVRAT
ncbi:MAG: 3-phosphoshikimate 1-carboxyvinyltransferase [Deltaproteobacteria bacterium]|nr:3-phosphoshikimate 1-carboxyvinyltransferase [Deltaproteobacteria bacterium]